MLGALSQHPCAAPIKDLSQPGSAHLTNTCKPKLQNASDARAYGRI